MKVDNFLVLLLAIDMMVFKVDVLGLSFEGPRVGEL